MRRLIANADLKVVRINDSRGLWIPPEEMRIVINTVGDVGYCLYSYYRTYPFREAEDITDEMVSKAIGWAVRKVQRYRLLLERQELLLLVRYGTKMNGITKMLVGEDVVALHKAGLPSNVLEGKAYRKLKKEFAIKTPEDLIKRLPDIVAHFEGNPDKY